MEGDYCIGLPPLMRRTPGENRDGFPLVWALGADGTWRRCVEAVRDRLFLLASAYDTREQIDARVSQLTGRYPFLRVS
jgi:hypothetical protein